MNENQNEDKAMANAKRQKLDLGTAFASPNKFAVLEEVNEDITEVNNANQNNTSTNQSSKVDKTPPIYICNVVNMNKFLMDLKEIEHIGTFKHMTVANNKVKLNCETIEGYRNVTLYLQSQNAEFYTYQIKSERNFRVVIRGLHPSCDTNLMMQELTDLGYQPVQMLPVFHPVSKIALPLFFLDLKPNEINDQIYELNRLYNAVIKVEPPRPKRTVIQCTRCQAYGHSKNYCHRNPRCVKCEGSHPTDKCTKNPKSPPICVNCKGHHTANYKGCPVHKELQKNGQSTNTNTTFKSKDDHTNKYKNIAEPNTVEHSFDNYSQPKENISYAGITSKNVSSANDPTNNLITKLLDRIDSLMSLLFPLINSLQQVLPILINKK